jgi:hypothetical protein
VTEDADITTPRRRTTSGPAIFGTLVAIAIAVLVGVFGPDMGRRGLVPEGIPLGAVVERLGEAHRSRVASENVPRSGWREAVEALGATRVLEPTGEVWTYRGAQIEDGVGTSFSDPNPVVVGVFDRDGDGGSGRVRLSVAAVADGGEFHRYDGFVRSTPLLDGEVLRFSAAETTNGVPVLVFVDGPVVWIVHCDDDKVLEDLTPSLLDRPAIDPEDPLPRQVRGPSHDRFVVPGRDSAEGVESRLESPIHRS